ncbi:hypothetical protein [Phytohabitans rumicis]|uniref:hypothetical protein n=1 Tax=Phytohabitans rumicis TaxID=1076125 RepID=UPI001566C533|nr:hypothetical protein [Phytohabitans rumicis]
MDSTADADPIVVATGPDPTSPDLATHLPQLQSGQFDVAAAAFNRLWANADNLSKQEQGAALKQWIDGVFGSPEARAEAATQPVLFTNLVGAARDLILDSDLGPPEYTDAWLRGNLDKLDQPGAAAVAERMVATGWGYPSIIGKDLRGWIRLRLGAGGLNNAEGGLAARLLSMLWNDGDYATICDLIADGIDTAQPAYYGSDEAPKYEGLWCGYVQPLEHLLGYYLRLASLPSLPAQTDPGGADVAVELTALGGKSPAAAGLDPAERRDLGARKVAGAAQILQALTVKGSAKILTSFAAVESSALLREFVGEPGTIWGFEHVRLPYVQAAHATPSGNQPLRMWELWQVVARAAEKPEYEALLSDPDRMIPKLVAEGVAAVEKEFVNRPADYLWWKLPDFKAAFEKQCTAYLRSLAEQPPRAKYATAAKRGHDFSAYLGSFGCNAGLWWALNQGTRVYYCLDGIKDADVIGYKKLKTSRINTFLQGKGNAYIECITLAEIRVILTRWDELKDIVMFTRKGEFVDKQEIVDLKTAMEAADKLAGTRLAPTGVPEFAEVIKKLDPKLLPSLNDDEIMRIAAQVPMLEVAAGPRATWCSRPTSPPRAAASCSTRACYRTVSTRPTRRCSPSGTPSRRSGWPPS